MTNVQWLFLCAAFASSALLFQFGVQQLEASGVASNSSLGRGQPWNRPGCFRVGHTRTISIPGCVKFNLSTNACRGFCMSFSIPAAEDIGPPVPSGHLGLPVPVAGANDGKQHQQLLMLLNRNNQENLALEQRFLDTLTEGKRRLDAESSIDPAGLEVPVEDDNQPLAVIRKYLSPLAPQAADGLQRGPDKLNTFLHLSGQMRSPLAGTVGNTGDKRDVISVGQCCNMMETEDVTVNLRCGINETRRLVFKSAKTCECFFCKHV